MLHKTPALRHLPQKRGLSSISDIGQSTCPSQVRVLFTQTELPGHCTLLGGQPAGIKIIVKAIHLFCNYYSLLIL